MGMILSLKGESSMFENVVLLSSPANAAPNVSVNTNGLDAILQASPVVQFTLLVLVFLSVMCWAVGFAKWKQLDRKSVV